MDGRRAVSGRSLRPKAPAESVTVDVLVPAFMKHADPHYRRIDGTPTHEIRDDKFALHPLVHLYGTAPFGERKTTKPTISASTCIRK